MYTNANVFNVLQYYRNLYDGEEPDKAWWLVKKKQQPKTVNATSLALHPSDSNSTLTSIYTEHCAVNSLQVSGFSTLLSITP